MPFEVLLLIFAFFGVGLWLIARPVGPTRVEHFEQRHGLTLTSTGRLRLQHYFAHRRQLRTAGVLIAAAIGLIGSIPDNRVAFAYVPTLTGWLLGALAVEVSQRIGVPGTQDRVVLPYWWRSIPAVIAVTAVLSTTAAVMLRSEGVEARPLVLWGVGALLAALAVIAATRYISARNLSDVDEADAAMGPAATVDGVRGLTIGGSILALACLARVWLQAVPGPFEEPDQFPVVAGLLSIAVLALMMKSATVVNQPGRRAVWGWLAYAVVAILPFAWGVPVRLAQEPPFTPAAAHATGQLRLAGLDQLVTARNDIGLTADNVAAANVGETGGALTQLLGRVDVAPAPSGSYYVVFGLNRGTNKGMDLYGGNGAWWYGRWSLDLPARYPWLAAVAPVADQNGFTGSIMAVPADDSGLLWFHTIIPANAPISVDDVQLVLMLVRHDDSYIYWATEVPTTSKTFA